MLNQLKALAAGGSSSAQDPKATIPWKDQVLMHPTEGEAHEGNYGHYVTATTNLTQDQAIAKFYGMSVDDQRLLGASLARAGIITNPGEFSQVFNAWQDAVRMADNAGKAGSPMSPWDAINIMETYGSGQANSTKAAKLAALPQSRTQRDITIPSPSDAESLVKSIFQQELGRDPSEQQLAKYKALMMGAAQKGTTTTAQYKYDENGNVINQTNTSTSPPDYQQLMKDQVQADPEYGAYQAATTYYNAALKAIASPV